MNSHKVIVKLTSYYTGMIFCCFDSLHKFIHKRSYFCMIWQNNHTTFDSYGYVSIDTSILRSNVMQNTLMNSPDMFLVNLIDSYFLRKFFDIIDSSCMIHSLLYFYDFFTSKRYTIIKYYRSLCMRQSISLYCIGAIGKSSTGPFILICNLKITQLDFTSLRLKFGELGKELP